jgi:putative SOS response-associated peptidase YedK
VYIWAMCGRYVTPDEAELESEYRVDRTNSDARIRRGLESFEPSFNLAPSQDAPVIRVVRDSGGKREALLMRWGLVPSWTHGEIPKFSTSNASIEKLESGPSWRGPWKKGQRCIMPAKGIYEWQVQPDGSKIPFYIRPAAENTTFAIAALWDESITPLGESILSSAIITMPANELMAKIHNTKLRMPLIIRAEDVETWLTGTPEQAKAVMKTYPSEEMVAWPVSKKVNSARNNSPDLIDAADTYT